MKYSLSVRNQRKFDEVLVRLSIDSTGVASSEELILRLQTKV